MILSRKIKQCDFSPIRKYHPYAVAAESRGRKIYHLNIGQPDIETPQAFFDAVKNYHQPVLTYAPSAGLPVFVESVLRYYQNMGIALKSSDILTTTGGSGALEIILSCILDEGDEILIPEPFYSNYSTFVRMTGGHIRPIPTYPEEGYRYADHDRIERLINEHTRAILITNPANPTGVVLSHAEMRLMVDIAKEHDLFIISDEVYREFVYDGEPLTSMAEFEDAAENVIIIDSVSKRFSACGARIGVLISRNQELIAEAMKLCQGLLCCATLDQIGAAALYDSDYTYFSKIREEYKKRRDTCMEGLLKIPGVVCTCPKGAFYIMAKLPVDNTEEFQKWLLEEFEDQGDTVMFAPGNGFYATPNMGRSEARLAYVLKQSDLERALDILAKGIKKYNCIT